MTDLDDLLPAIAAGDTHAFGRWMAVAEPRLRDSLRGFAAQADTEAVVQETLLKLWQIAPRVERDARGNSFLRLGIRIARNLCLDQVRRRRTVGFEAPALAELEELAVEAREADPFLGNAIQRCREQLPGKPGAAFSARLESRGGEHDRDLAQRLGMQLNTFLQNVGRARKFLLECLRRSGIDLSLELS